MSSATQHDAIDVLMSEHDNILRMVEVVRSMCAGILDGAPVVDEDFRRIIQFVRNYADKHHHGKEEAVLFDEMMQRLGQVAVNVIQHGMLVEHDLGRLFITELEAALDRYQVSSSTRDKLDIITNVCSWAALLERHITKENDTVFQFARRALAAEVLTDVDVRSNELEEAATEQGVQAHYLDMLDRLETAYVTDAHKE